MLRVMEEDAEETADLKVFFYKVVTDSSSVTEFWAENSNNNAQGAAAALHFILTCAAKHDVDEVSLIQEIQQLGLPQENASIIGAEYRDCKVALQQRLASDSYRLSRVLDTNWRVDVLVPPEATASSDVSIHLRLLVDNQPQSELVADYTDAVSARVSGNQNSVDDLTFSLSETQLDLLILELTQAKQILDQMKV